MKKLIFMCAVLVGLTTASFAQSHKSADEKAKGLQKELGLSKTQCEKVSAIYSESSNKFDKLKMKEHGDNAKLSKSIAPLRAETVGKIKAVLTPAQKVKYDKLLKEPNNQGAGWGEGWSSSN